MKIRTAHATSDFKLAVLNGHLCRIDILRTSAGKKFMRPPRLASVCDLEAEAKRQGCTPAELKDRLGIVDRLWLAEREWRPGHPTPTPHRFFRPRPPAGARKLA